MAGDNFTPPDTGGRSISYAERAKMNIRFNQNLKRNVLEIEVEKDTIEDEMILSEQTIATLLNKMNLNISSHVEGYQVSHGRKKAKIEVLCRADLDLEKFCIHESLQVEKGVKTNFIRPAGRKDVEVTVAGLGFNTPDSLVQEYITKFGGKMVTNNVIYGKFTSGPFNGKLNGVRKYQFDLTELHTPMGTFHMLNGNKVKVFFRGNKSTCGYCHKDVTKCPGEAKAKNCKEKGTKQVHLGDHMQALWKEIKFDPQSFEITKLEYDDLESLDNIGGDRKVLDTDHFPRQQVDRPTQSDSEKEKFNVVRIRNLPLDLSDEDIVKFLNEKVDKDINKKDIKLEKTQYSTNVFLGPGPSLEIIAKAMEVLDYKTSKNTFFEARKLHLQLHRPLTPNKPSDTKVSGEGIENDDKTEKMAVLNKNKICLLLGHSLV